MPNIILNKTSYYFYQAGEGSPIVFAHGLFVDHTIFKHQIAHLKERYCCYSFDMPGHGRSAIINQGWSLDDIVEDFRVFLVSKQLSNVTLVGQSQGGMVFMRLAIKYPKLVSKLILIGTSAKAEYKERIPFWQDMVGTFGNGNKSDFEDCMAIVQESVVSKYFSEKYKGEKDDELLLMQNQNPAYMALATEAAILSRVDISSSLERINCATLILCGEDDQATPLEVSKDLSNKISNSKMILVAQSAHHIPIENPYELNRHIEEFLGTNSNV